MQNQNNKIPSTDESWLVSAVITTHNRKDLLKKAIDSVFAQTYPNMELIVVSDASTDGTDEMCSGRNDIKYISIPKEESRGGNYARNLGINAAKGEYVAFLDDDDAWFPTKIEKQCKLAKERDCSVVYCLREFDIRKGNKKIKWNEPSNKPEGDLSNRIFRHYVTSTSCLLVKRNLLMDIEGFDEKMVKWQEYDLMIRLAEKSDIYCAPEYLCLFLSNKGDVHRVSNQVDRLPVTIDYLQKKYKSRIKALPFADKIRFYYMCASDMLSLGRKTRNLSFLLKYYPLKSLYGFIMLFSK